MILQVGDKLINPIVGLYTQYKDSLFFRWDDHSPYTWDDPPSTGAPSHPPGSTGPGPGPAAGGPAAGPPPVDPPEFAEFADRGRRRWSTLTWR